MVVWPYFRPNGLFGGVGLTLCDFKEINRFWLEKWSTNSNTKRWLLLNNTFFKATIATYNQWCYLDVGCDSTQGLSCSVNNQTLYVCVCASKFYWTGATCAAQKLKTAVTCSSTAECRNDLGLYCSTTCVCNSTFYWDTALLQCGN